MESAGPKLNILFSPGFLGNLCDQIEKARLALDDDLFIEHTTIKQNLFKFSDDRRVRLINGRDVSEEMFNKVYADLRMTPTMRAALCDSMDKELEAIPDPETIVLLNSSESDTKIIAIENSVFVLGPTTIIKDYRTLTFDNKFNMPFQIKANYRKEDSFNFQDAFTPYRIPVNKVVLLDPYLYTSDNETIKMNLVELISALFTGKDPGTCPAMEIKIITTFPKEFKSRKEEIFPEIPKRRSRVAEIKSILASCFNTFTNVKFKVICIDIFELNTENSEIKKVEIKKRQERQKNHLSVYQRKTKTLFNLCKKFIHDRWFFTNYYVCDSGRGFSPLLRNKSKEVYTPYWTKINLFSLLQKEHYLYCRALEKEWQKLESNKDDNDISRFFYES